MPAAHGMAGIHRVPAARSPWGGRDPSVGPAHGAAAQGRALTQTTAATHELPAAHALRCRHPMGWPQPVGWPQLMRRCQPMEWPQPEGWLATPGVGPAHEGGRNPWEGRTPPSGRNPCAARPPHGPRRCEVRMGSIPDDLGGQSVVKLKLLMLAYCPESARHEAEEASWPQEVRSEGASARMTRHAEGLGPSPWPEEAIRPSSHGRP